VRGEVIRRLLDLMRGQWWLMAISASCRVVNQSLGVVIPAIAAAFVAGVASESAPSLAVIVWTLVGLAVVKGTFRYLEQFTGHAVAFRLLARLRNQTYRWLERLEPARLEGQRSGDLVARVSGDIDRVEPFYAHTIAPLLAAIVVPALTVLGAALLVDPRPALVLFGFSVLYLAVVPWIGRKGVERLRPETRRLAGESAAEVADIVQGAHEIAVLAAGPTVLAEAERSDGDLMAAEESLARGSARRALAGGLISAATLVSVTALGALEGLDVSDLVISVVLAWTIMTPLRALEEIIPDTEQALAAAGRLFDLEDLEPQTGGASGRSSRAVGVRFDEVTVAAGESVLVQAVDLEMPPGSFLGIVGPSGSGKSTLVQSLIRHRDPSSGRVMLGESEVRDLSPAALSETVAFVPQRPDIFHGTLRSNLLIADPDAADDELFAALGKACLLDWVRGLGAGLDSPLGERGVGMSGGQLQRLALARAFLRDPAVLVLDEATSELDAATEEAVLQNVSTERGETTLIVVAHRMETIVTADLIAVIDGGKLVEAGSHEELKAKGGLYAALWERHEDLLTGV
jgi:ATP-binding cassette subfamily C protein CydC